VARAKRTHRADARRRYRQEQAARAESGEVEEEAPARPRKGDAQPATPTGRPSVTAAFRAAARPADIRSDLSYLPTLVVRTKAVWLPSLLVVGAGVAFLIPQIQDNIVGVLVFQAFVFPPPLAATFLAGLLAPRGAWLAGLVVGVVAAGVFAVVAALFQGSTAAGLEASTLRDAVLYAFAVAPIFGLGAGAFAGFYRRFLQFGAPARRAQKDRRSANRR
jgi:hypothetical protein